MMKNSGKNTQCLDVCYHDKKYSKNTQCLDVFIMIKIILVKRIWCLVVFIMIKSSGKKTSVFRCC